ncbi:MAG TPA: ABC transporter ATP-binding protein [Pyrinomonadaceae bacterium]|jgi:iron complex transport system ATP-binding protein|nr:ABC transporter ATP-binding protein [Pyrinomonadaceae bacterium]
MLDARDLTIAYDHRIAVADVTLSLKPGEITAIIGPNGAGKSTLLKSLNSQVSPSSGTILLDGQPLERLNRRTISRRIAVVAQEAELRFPVTVLEFVLGGRFAWATNAGWGWETEHDLQIADAVLRETELSELSGRLMNELSGGERQRALMARALATEAPILLLDEPTANLDLSHQATLLALVRNRCDRKEAAALVVTHDINLAAQFADNLILMKQGRAVHTGTPEQVLQPQILQDVFEVTVLVDAHPVTGGPRVTPVHDTYRHS